MEKNIIEKNDDEVVKKDYFIGMRVIKTVISVFISAMITTSMGGMPINSVVASVLSTQDSQDGSINYGKNRIIGTIAGAIFALGFVFTVDIFDIPLFTVQYYLVMSLMIIPIVKILMMVNLKNSASSAIITFMIALMSYIAQNDLKYVYVKDRIIDTFVGVIVSIAINILLPDNRKK